MELLEVELRACTPHLYSTAVVRPLTSDARVALEAGTTPGMGMGGGTRVLGWVDGGRRGDDTWALRKGRVPVLTSPLSGL